MPHGGRPITIARRRFLQSGLIAPPLIAGLCRLAHGEQAGRPLLLIGDGLTAGTDPRNLRAFVDSLAAQRLKLGLVLSGAAADMAPLAACIDAYPDFVEWIIDAPSVLDDLPYFQMRQASAAQKAFAGFRSPCDTGATGRDDCLTLACRQPPGAVPTLTGVRAAGFRNVLLLPEADRKVECWTTDNGVLQVMGGRRVKLSDLDPLFSAMTEPGDAADPVFIYLSLDELTGFSNETLKTVADTLSDAIATAMYDGIVRPMSPSEFHLAGFDASRLIGLHFVLAEGGDASLPSLVEPLTARGASFSHSDAAGAPAAPGDLQRLATCAQLTAAPTDADWQGVKSAMAGALGGTAGNLAAPEVCIVAGNQSPDLVQAIARTGATVVAPTTAEPSQAVGLDNDGLLHIPAALDLRVSEAALATRRADAVLNHGSNRLRDLLILIRPDAASGRDAPPFGDWLLNLIAGGDTAMVDLPGLARGIMSVDPIFALLKRAAAEEFVEVAEAGAIDATQRELLLADARLAWRYFSRLSDRRSGLARSTAQADGANLTSYPLVTMWEIGSQILATISALRIGIIDEAAFSGQIARLLGSIPAGKVGGLALPQSNVSVDRAPQAAEGFSASDTGRLLVALRILAREFNMEKEVARIVARWDLAKVTAGRRLHNVANGHLTEYSNSNYVDYAARGFALFGFETQSPYEVGTAETGTDRQMRLLSRASELGPVATEPHVLEELELGYSEASRLIARLLFTAQFSAFQATGKLFCVSETALDREPWFSYQGFRLGAKGDPWTVDSTLGSTEYQTEASRAAIRLVNTKAAYAWAAVRPHPYSHKLLAAVRTSARIPDLGFAAGIYVESGTPTKNLTDTNTNAVILESIAYMLSGRRPMLTLR